MSWNDLVDRAFAQVGGLDWEGIEASYGPGALFTPEGETFVFEQFIIPAIEMLGDVIDKYEWLPTDAEIAELDLDEVRAWRSNIESVKRNASRVAGAFDRGQETLDEGVELSSAALRMNVLNTYLVCVYGVDLWLSPPIVLRAAKYQLDQGVPIEEIESMLKGQLDAIFRAAKSVVWMDNIGVFYFVPKKGQSMTGLGALPAIPAYVVITLTLGVILLVGMLYWIKEAADFNEMSLKASDDLCKEAQRQGDTDTVQKCIQTYADERGAATDAIAQAASESLREATKWGMIGLGGIAVVYLLPTLVPRVLKAGVKSRQTLKEAKA